VADRVCDSSRGTCFVNVVLVEIVHEIESVKGTCASNCGIAAIPTVSVWCYLK